MPDKEITQDGTKFRHIYEKFWIDPDKKLFYQCKNCKKLIRVKESGPHFLKCKK